MMFAMLHGESFSLKTGEHVLRAAIHLPKHTEEGKRPGAVVLCMGLQCTQSELPLEELRTELIHALSHQGLAAVTYQPHCADALMDEYHGYSAEDDLSDARLALEGVCRSEVIDASRIGVFGMGLGSLAAIALADESKQGVRLCVYAPAAAWKLQQEERTGQWHGYAMQPSLLPRRFRETVESVYGGQSRQHWSGKSMILGVAADRDFTLEDADEYEHMLRDAGADVETIVVPFATHALPEIMQCRFVCEQIANYFGAMVAVA